jgi:hypothetical protein
MDARMIGVLASLNRAYCPPAGHVRADSETGPSAPVVSRLDLQLPPRARLAAEGIREGWHEWADAEGGCVRSGCRSTLQAEEGEAAAEDEDTAGED